MQEKIQHRPKPRTELASQAKRYIPRAEEIFGEPIVPPSLNTLQGINALIDIPAQQLQKQYIARLGLYADIFRADWNDHLFTPEERAQGKTRLEILNNLDRYITNHQKQEGGRVLFDAQMEVFLRLRDALEAGMTEGYFKLPTSFGKTVFSTEFINAVGKKTLVVVPTIEGVEQAEETFATFAKNKKVGKIYGNEKKLGEDVTIITYHSLVKQMQLLDEDPEKAILRPDDFDVLILDEVHHSFSPRRAEAVSKFSKSIKLGFSATPYRSDDRNAKNLLNNEIYAMTIKDAAARGLLSDFVGWFAYTDIDLSDVSVVEATGSYDEKELEKKIDVHAMNKAAVALYLKVFQDKISTANVTSVKAARSLADLFNANGVPAAAIWGEMDPEERREIVKKHKTGEIKVLCGKRLLIEAYNNPAASVCLNIAPAYSPGDEEQRSGRVLRVDPHNPEKEAVIVDWIYTDNRWGREQFTFPEIAGAAESRRVATRIGKGGKATRSETPDIEIEGLRVTTNVEEVLRVSSEKKILREQGMIKPEFSLISFSALGKQYKIADITVSRILKQIELQYPQHFVSNEKGRYFVTTEGAALLKTALESQISDTYTQIPMRSLAEEFTLSEGSIQKLVKLFSKNHQEHFSRRGKGYAYVATTEGHRMIRDILERPQFPEGYVQVPTHEYAKKFTLSEGTINIAVRKIRASHPEHFTGGGYGQAHAATEEGTVLLLAELQRALITDEFTQLDTNGLRKDYKISSPEVYAKIGPIIEKHPDLIRKGKAGRYFAVPQGVALLREAIETRHIPRGFSLIRAAELATTYGLSESIVGACIRFTKGQDPNNFYAIPNGKFTGATEEGMRQLDVELKRRTIPEGYARVTISQLIKDYKVAEKSVLDFIAELQSEFPDDFGKNDVGTYYATPEGSTKLVQAIAQRNLPAEGFLRVITTEIAQDMEIMIHTVRINIRKLQKERPDLVIGGKEKPFDITPEGLIILKKRLSQIKSNQEK